jgi:cyclohexanecarboxylate-CoA ligase
VVALQLPNWWQFNAMHLACLRIGAITNPLMPIFRERELTFMLGFAESKVVVAPARFRGFDYKPMIDAMKPSLPDLRHTFFIGGEGPDSFEAAFLADPLEEQAGADRLEGRRPSPNDVIELIYTSGTTGQPKGVMHTSNTTIGHLKLWVEHHGLDSQDRLLMASPLAHQTGFLYGMVLPVMLGVEVVLQDRWHPPLAAEIIQRHRCTFTMGATPFLNDLVHMPNIGNFDISSLKTFVSAGAPIPPALVQHAAANFNFKVLSGWGMTECACPTICRQDDPDEKVWTSDGAPLPGSEVTVRDEEGREVPIGTEGDLKIRGSSLFVGYLKKPELHGTDAEGWFDTGDRARMDAQGYIRISGRSKDIIIRGGENIPVAELEDVLFRHPAVQDVAVVGVPDDRLGERGCAYVTLTDGASFNFEDMRAYFEEKGTAKQYWPEFLEVIDEMPRTPSGKIQKFKLRDMRTSGT